MVIARAGLLLPAPFHRWLTEQLGETSAAELARRMGVSHRAVTQLRDGRKSPNGATGLLSVGLVDYWLIRSRSKVRIQDLYGELLALSEPDWKGGECSRCGAHLREPAQLCGFCEAS